jgi:cellobiose phosphorylase
LNLNCYSTEPGESFQLAGHIKNDHVAESLMIAGLFCVACDDLAALLQAMKQPEKAGKYGKYADEMRESIETHGWDGEWFLRAYDALGRKVGSQENKEGKIFIESQGWGIMAGAGRDKGYAQKALNSVRKHLATPDGIVLHQPAFQTYHVHLGEVSSYPPGYKENAGIFNHNNPWIQIAETLLGNGDQAMAYFKSICPAVHAENIDIYRSEPYVYSQMTAGRDAPTPGEAKNSWLTGTAAWTFITISQYILGIQPTYSGLRIDPCIPAEWQKITVNRIFRQTHYKIIIENPQGACKGVKMIHVDGRPVKNNILPLFSDGKVHTVSVVMG